MSLNWSISEVKDWPTVCKREDGSLNYHTKALIWASLSCGYSCITEANYVNVFERLSIYEKMRGAFVQYADRSEPITLLHVKSNIGLTTNASKWTDTYFNKNLMRVMWEDAKASSRFQLKELS